MGTPNTPRRPKHSDLNRHAAGYVLFNHLVPFLTHETEAGPTTGYFSSPRITEADPKQAKKLEAKFNEKGEESLLPLLDMRDDEDRPVFVRVPVCLPHPQDDFANLPPLLTQVGRERPLFFGHREPGDTVELPLVSRRLSERWAPCRLKGRGGTLHDLGDWVTGCPEDQPRVWYYTTPILSRFVPTIWIGTHEQLLDAVAPELRGRYGLHSDTGGGSEGAVIITEGHEELASVTRTYPRSLDAYDGVWGESGLRVMLDHVRRCYLGLRLLCLITRTFREVHVYYSAAQAKQDPRTEAFRVRLESWNWHQELLPGHPPFYCSFVDDGARWLFSYGPRTHQQLYELSAYAADTGCTLHVI